MTSFIEEVIIDIHEKNLNVSELTFVLPSKRAGVFLKHELSKVFKSTFFAPEILSTETFVETLSNLQYINNTELIFEFYDVYLKATPKENVEPFDQFYKWAQILLQDFNEIDRYLVAPQNIFDYLTAIKEIEHHHWSVDENQTDYIKNYLAFWKRLKQYYELLNDQLISKRKGYQGLVYREAVNNLEQFTAANQEKTFVFVGFNALNKAEETIIQELLQQDIAIIYWDLDQRFFKDSIHDAGMFIRQHKANWPYFRKNPINWLSNNYPKPKTIDIIGTPKNIGQVKYIGELLQRLKNEKNSLKNTAVVLGNESLLMPLLNSMPEDIGLINITMGLPLNAIPLASLFEKLFAIQKSTSKTLYYKDVITILSHQFIKPLLVDNDIDHADTIIDHIQNNNIANITAEGITELAPSKTELLELLFNNWNNNPRRGLSNCSKLIMSIKAFLDKDKSKQLLSLEYLYRFNEIFNTLGLMLTKHEHIESINTLHGLYRELIKNETLDFKGEPLQGLQIMGMLESRVLDFETVIIASVNEGVLPAGKSNNSFIPFDVKIENNLPTYKEKDAVYTYHFYRLLQRANTVFLVYNTEPDVLQGNEKSRFITQLEIDNIHNINHYIVSPKVPAIQQSLTQIKKTDAVLSRIKEIAEKGFSPSSLTNYIRNPIDFYKQKILGIKEFDDVEETVAANTLGTTIHNTLEDFYTPYIGKELTSKDVEAMKPKIHDTVLKHFKNEYKKGDTTKGKNLIIFEIAKRYVSNFLDLEIDALQQGNTIKIISVEEDNKVKIDIPELDFPVYLTGKVDRIDEFNGTTRIIDYKSGKVEASKVKISQWEDLTTDYDKYSKPFQILAYAYMLNSKKPFTAPVEAGIISFKNLGSGFLKFTENKNTLISQETLENYTVELRNLILEICNPNIDFIEKEV